MKNISIEPVPISDALPQISAVTSLYKKVFAAPPWNEAYKCPSCDRSFGKDTADGSTCCGMSLVEYYPLAETSKTISDCLRMTRARIALALDRNQTPSTLVGFSWGWEDRIADANERIFKLEADVGEKLSGLLGMKSDDPFFYLSEFGLEESYRNQGIGKNLYTALLDSRDRNETDAILMRTSKQSPAFFISTQNAKYPLKVVYEYGDEKQRVILAS